MNKPEWINWLKEQQPILDDVISKAGLQFFEGNQKNENFWYDLRCCQKESYNLRNGKDLCYDRIATPLSYSLWYQARRINTFLSHFLEQLIDIGNEKTLDVFDLGAGTGAVQMCLGLIYYRLKKNGQQTPRLRVFNIDSSPFMLAYNRNLLWPEFLKQYPETREIEVEYHVNSWNNSDNIELSSPWISASYLFDISDNKNQIKDDFLEIVNSFKPSNLLLLTSDQPKKRELLNNLCAELIKNGWNAKNETVSNLLFSGTLPKVNALRTHYSKIAEDYSLGRETNWQDFSFISTKITKLQSVINYNNNISIDQKINLYNPPFKIRKTIKLSEDQVKAAKNSNRPAVIIGPAGCGKSVVITERVINIIKENKDLRKINILLTTFNKELLKKLTEWISDLLLANNFKTNFEHDLDNTGGYRESGIIKCVNGTFSIRLLHFDMLAQYIGDISYVFFNETQHETILKRCISEVITEKGIDISEYEPILNPEFLFEEYHRVIYGLQCRVQDGIDAYQSVNRTGRGNNPSLKRGLRRELVWKCLNKYARIIYLNNYQSFTTRRQLLIHKIRSNKVDYKFDYVVIDEFQDCTQADFEIFWGLLKNSNNLIISGDIAQAIHIGRSAAIPSRDEKMGNREFFRLKGSYRLPQRISECIVNLSKKIKESGGNSESIEEITPYKGSPPGARPIIVYGLTIEEMAEKIKSIFNSYKIFGVSKVTILEKDNRLCNALKTIGVDAETDTVLKLKGLEKECVVWATDRVVEFEREAKEFVYTILTRTSCLLIIAFNDSVCESYKGIFSLLDQDRLIFWDQKSETKFMSNIIPFVEVNGDDEDY